MFLVGASVRPRPGERPIVIGLLQVRPPSTERTAISCVVFGARGLVGSVPTIAITSSREPSSLTRILLIPGQLLGVCGSYSFRGVDQVWPPSVVFENRL